MLIRDTVTALMFFSIVLGGMYIVQLKNNYQELAQQCMLLGDQQQEIRAHAYAPGITSVDNNSGILAPTVVSSWENLQSRVRNTVVQVFSQLAEFDWLQPFKTPRQGQGTGTAFFVNDSGELITNAHVVNQARSVFIQIPSLGKIPIEVDVVGVSQERDIALLRVKPEGLEKIKLALGKIPFLPLGNSDQVMRAQEIMALGYPLGQQALKSTTGVVSGREQHMIQITAPINPGNSGGPALNIRGEVVGINTAVINGNGVQNTGYIIPINEAKIILDDLRKVKLLRKPFLGLFYSPGSEELARYLKNPVNGGVFVAKVFKNSPLDLAGVKNGDMLYELNGHAIDYYGDMNVDWAEDKISITDYVSHLELGQKVRIGVYRNGKKLDFTVTFGNGSLPPVRIMHPGYEEIDYEIMGGMVIMPLTINHVVLMAQNVPMLLKYQESNNQYEPVLIITHIFHDSAAQRSRSLLPGMTIKEINGIPVKTLADFRAAVQESIKTGYLTVRTNDELLVALPFDRVLADEENLALDNRYMVSPLVQNCKKACRLDEEKSATA